jgi:hypothetical protein
VEFISIGENIKAIYGKAPYLFTLEKIFEILQFNFLTRLKSADSATQQDENAVDKLKFNT